MDQRDRTQWLYAHFQAISKAASRYLLLLFTAAVLGLAVVLSSSEEIKVPIFLIVLQRHWLLSGLAFYGLFLTLAYCGNFEKGEETLQKLSEILNVDYSELDFVDTSPTVIDYARHARTQRALGRTVVGRFVAMMIYSIAVVGGYLWFWCLLVIGIVSRSSPGTCQ